MKKKIFGSIAALGLIVAAVILSTAPAAIAEDPVVTLNQQRVSTGNDQHTLSQGSGVGVAVECPAGWEVTGGGYVLPDSAPVRVVQSHPDETFSGTLLKTWAVRVVAESSTTFTLNVWAVCISLTES